MNAKPSQETNSCRSFEKLSFEDRLLCAGLDREEAKGPSKGTSPCCPSSARMGLIPLGSPAGTWPGQLTWTAPARGVCCQWHHAGVWGGSARGEQNCSWECAGHWAVRVAPGIRLVLYILLVSVVAVAVRSLCQSVTLPLAHPAGLAFFSPFCPQPSGGRGGGPLGQAPTAAQPGAVRRWEGTGWNWNVPEPTAITATRSRLAWSRVWQ